MQTNQKVGVMVLGAATSLVALIALGQMWLLYLDMQAADWLWVALRLGAVFVLVICVFALWRTFAWAKRVIVDAQHRN